MITAARVTALVLVAAVGLGAPAPAPPAHAVGAPVSDASVPDTAASDAPMVAEDAPASDTAALALAVDTVLAVEAVEAIDAGGDASGSPGAAADGDAAGGADAGADADASGTANASAAAGANGAAGGDASGSAGADAGASADAGGPSDASAAGTAAGSAAADGAPEAPDPGAPDAPDAEPDGPRGPNGGLASNSPGPETARPADGRELAEMRAFAQAATALRGDDYPARYRNLPWPYVDDRIWDEWNFAYRQCTSFVAWRLNSANGIPFSNQYLGLVRWGDAGQWADSARSVGIRVDTTPEIGAVAWSGPYYSGASAFGHVAWVADVLDNGNVVIEEYNAGWAGAYSTRTVAPGAFQGYIHIADMGARFTKTGAASISGIPMVGGELRASGSGWSPAPSGYAYRWFRDGAAIAGATGATYRPVLADVGAAISVEVSAQRPRYRPSSAVSSATVVLMTDSDGDGIDDTQQMLPWNSDVNGDGLPDAVGFAPSGVQVSLRTKTGMGPAKTWTPGFGTGNGWSVFAHPRTLVDVNGDGRSDVVGFAEDGVHVALSTGSGFAASQRWSSGFGAASGWSVKFHPRTLADVTGDGLPDVVGFASDGVYVATGTGSGFAAPAKWYSGFSTATGWTVDATPRWLVDMNGDGRADVVGIGKSGVYVALSTGSGFGGARLWSPGYATTSGWGPAHHPRTIADANGDGRPDVVGFASDGVYVALNTGSGLGAMTRWRAGFGTASGWTVGENPRTLADVDGDGRADVVGFGASGVTVALSTGSGFAAPTRWSDAFGAASWRSDRQPRMVTDVNGDGRADIAAFGNSGLRVALSTGSGFGGASLQLQAMGYSATGWRVAAHPRAIGVQTLIRTPAPTVSGQVRVGERLTAALGSWQPSPVSLSSQWLRDGEAIAGKTARSYTLTPEDLGTRISIRTTGTKPGYAPVSRRSTAYTVAPGLLTPVVPTVSGTAAPGSTLQARAGTWGPGTVSLAYRWHRNGAPIGGATSAAYRVTDADVGHRITVTVTGTKRGYTTASRVSAVVKVAGVPALPASTPFADVPTTHRFYREIAWMSTSGLSTGTPQPSGTPVYRPAAEVSRSAMAAFLFRMAAMQDYRPPARSPFVDVPTTHRFSREIAWMHDAGLSTGTPTAAGAVYGPDAPVTRGAMAAFLYRLEAPQGFTPPSVSPFADVRPEDRFYTEIAWMHDAGLATGTAQPTGKPRFGASGSVSRAAMAAFLYRLETGG
ncbi:FG-GAP-like repeat-containing protein [Leucobacter allii]|uniref:FG-GAP-like repeat-containing protein n=1 Tax=Leucobacter allii TaxID=2932247 RepID=A0ABY4FN31_9MICO|nr:FG-GAP-like repeat-containing protein [Leucobacter allii]UOQ57685.1 FG-GAP-like repeat-containing protein [Leucobacter allii]